MEENRFERYAIFYTPPNGPFADLTTAWLGWDSALGQAAAQPHLPGLDLAKLTMRPRKYGFHATLKAPFHLAEAADFQTLLDAVDTIAQNHTPITVGRLEFSTDHGFLALRPMANPVALRNLASALVRKLDHLRAPLTPEDITRRRKSRLSPRQDQQMLDWGYPYIFEDFHFHMTLTGPLRQVSKAAVLSQAQKMITPALPPLLEIDAVTLMGQDKKGMFHQIRRARLAAR